MAINAKDKHTTRLMLVEVDSKNNPIGTKTVIVVPNEKMPRIFWQFRENSPSVQEKPYGKG